MESFLLFSLNMIWKSNFLLAAAASSTLARRFLSFELCVWFVPGCSVPTDVMTLRQSTLDWMWPGREPGTGEKGRKEEANGAGGWVG